MAVGPRESDLSVLGLFGDRVSTSQTSQCLHPRKSQALLNASGPHPTRREMDRELGAMAQKSRAVKKILPELQPNQRPRKQETFRSISASALASGFWIFCKLSFCPKCLAYACVLCRVEIWVSSRDVAALVFLQ